MTEKHNDYIIGGGKEGKARLDVLSKVLYPYTKSLLEMDGDLTGKSLLDLGCGGGNVSLMAVKMVGPSGRITAIDFDEEIVSLVQQDALSENLDNISFGAINAYDVAYNDEFDIAYARFLLSHLQHPLEVLRKMVQGVKPGGRIVVEDVQFSGHFCYPACPAFAQYLDFYTSTAARNHQNPEIGPSLPGLFQLAGIKKIQFDVIQPCFNKGQGKRMAYITLDRIKNAVVEQGIASMQTIERLLSELENFTNDEQSIISLPRIFRVWGYKL